MRTEGIGSTAGLVAAVGERQEPPGRGFADMVTQAIGSLSQLHAAAERAAESVATGDLSRLQEAVIAMQEASLAVDLVVAVRNHLVDGVHELLRTQV